MEIKTYRRPWQPQQQLSQTPTSPSWVPTSIVSSSGSELRCKVPTRPTFSCSWKARYHVWNCIKGDWQFVPAEKAHRRCTPRNNEQHENKWCVSPFCSKTLSGSRNVQSAAWLKCKISEVSSYTYSHALVNLLKALWRCRSRMSMLMGTWAFIFVSSRTEASH